MVSTRLISAPEGHLTEDTIRDTPVSRRQLMGLGVFSALSYGLSAPSSAAVSNTTSHLKPWMTSPGNPVAMTPYGQPSRHQEGLARITRPSLSPLPQNSASFAPLQGMMGIITPSGLHYERHHSGWADIDPRQHELLISGLDDSFVAKPRIFTLEDLQRLPSVSRIHFIECSGNTGSERKGVAAPTVQYTHGLLSCSEFTGVPLRMLLEACGADLERGKYILAEGADAAGLTRTIPMSMVLNDEVLVAYGQNGEYLRPENGYPLRLVVPGGQGVSWVKWLKRIELGDKPYGARDEAIHYIDPMPDGTHRQYTSLQEVKSVITSPSGGQTLHGRGYTKITGFAWSGRGKVKHVDISTDGGRSWREARFSGEVLSKSLTRFEFDWEFNGQEAIIQSRATDETGHVQPSYAQYRAVRGNESLYHNNAIQSWGIDETGEVSNVQIA